MSKFVRTGGVPVRSYIAEQCTYCFHSEFFRQVLYRNAPTLLYKPSCDEFIVIRV